MMVIRDAQECDVRHLARISQTALGEAWREADFHSSIANRQTLIHVVESNYNGMLSAPASAVRTHIETVENDVPTSPSAVFGYAVLVFAADQGEIPSIAIDDAYRGNGWGRALLRHILTEAGEHGVREVFLEVRRSNAAARALYASAGFTQIAVRRDFYEHPREDALLMKVEL